MLLPFIVPVLFCAAWQAVAVSGLLGKGMFPSVTDSLAALADWIFGGKGNVFSATWHTATLASLVRVLTGFLIGASVAIVLGLLGGVSPTVRSMFDPSINAIRSVSITAWVPIALIVFGIGFKPAVFLTALCTFFPVYVNVLAGARSVDRNLVQAAKMLGATPSQVTLRVVLPWTLPAMVTGLRVAAALAWTTVVVSEMLGAQSGIGYTLIYSYNQFQFDYVVAGMIAVGFCGFMTDKLLERGLERRLSWVEKRAAR
ncbi:MAG: ABC transporter permease [Pseudomonadota bacterium]